MAEKNTKRVVALLLALVVLALAAPNPASAQVEKATVKINGMI